MLLCSDGVLQNFIYDNFPKQRLRGRGPGAQGPKQRLRGRDLGAQGPQGPKPNNAYP